MKEFSMLKKIIVIGKVSGNTFGKPAVSHEGQRTAYRYGM